MMSLGIGGIVIAKPVTGANCFVKKPKGRCGACRFSQSIQIESYFRRIVKNQDNISSHQLNFILLLVNIFWPLRNGMF